MRKIMNEEQLREKLREYERRINKLHNSIGQAQIIIKGMEDSNEQIILKEGETKRIETMNELTIRFDRLKFREEIDNE